MAGGGAAVATGAGACVVGGVPTLGLSCGGGAALAAGGAALFTTCAISGVNAAKNEAQLLVLYASTGWNGRWPRTPQEYEDLARDPDHGNEVSPKTENERKIILELEESGKIRGPSVRDPSGAAEYFDANGTPWDIKSFNSNYPPKQGGFVLTRDLEKIRSELFISKENVIIDTTNLSAIHEAELRKAITANGWESRIKWYP